jgi:DNA-binding transcriptional regulator YhcF (GntR family)
VFDVIRIDVTSARPLEDQIVAGLRQALAEREIGPGDELPSVRQLAGDLGVHWNTVARAYRRLADERLLLVRRGRSVIAREPAPQASRAARSSLRDRLNEAIAAAVLGGIPSDEIGRIFQEALARFGERR